MFRRSPPFFRSGRGSDAKIKENILAGKYIDLQEPHSDEVRDLISKLLTVDPRKRLGAFGAQEIKSHAWFDGFDWTALEEGNMKGHFFPGIDTPDWCTDPADTQK